jgi:CubicO group peptidase (beta-lactamase class C family)
MKKFLKITLLSLVAIILMAVLFASITFSPIMAGMAAKTVCSCVYVSDRSIKSIREKELQVFPGLASAQIELTKDSTVRATILFSTAEAIYRKGLGCTLLAERSKEEVKNQQIRLPEPPQYSQDTIAWPQGDVLSDTTLPNIDYSRIHYALKNAFVDQDSTKPANTLAVVVVYNGHIIGEHYAVGRTKHSKLMGWSMSKSVTNAMIGLLVKEGKLDVDAPAPVTEWKADERSKITLNNLLQASSGLQWSETYFNPFKDFHQMFIKRDDKGAYAASRPLLNQPNTHFQYSSGSTNILSRIIRQQVGDADYYAFPYEKLFYKIGMLNTVVESDASGTFVGSSYSFATARDWARFGQLYLQDGIWEGERILPEGWVTYTTTPTTTAPLREYGAQWWLNVGAKQDASKCKYPKLPRDTFWADGFEEQYVMVVPSKKLVVVRLGVSHHGFAMEDMMTEIITSLPNN